MSDSTAIDQGLIDYLLADATLRGLMPDGVFWEEAGASMLTGGASTRFVLVSLVDEGDVDVFGGRAFEDGLYQVKAVEFVTATMHIRAAAARLDVLLDPQPPLAPAVIVIPGYGLMGSRRETRIRMTEPDSADPASLRVQHRGGHYRLQASLVA